MIRRHNSHIDPLDRMVSGLDTAYSEMMHLFFLIPRLIVLLDFQWVFFPASRSDARSERRLIQG